MTELSNTRLTSTGHTAQVPSYDLVIISSSFSTETEGILFIVSLSEWGGRPGVRRGRVVGGVMWLWNVGMIFSS